MHYNHAIDVEKSTYCAFFIRVSFSFSYCDEAGYMVDYTDTATGEKVANHKWVTESELSDK